MSYFKEDILKEMKIEMIKEIKEEMKVEIMKEIK